MSRSFKTLVMLPCVAIFIFVFTALAIAADKEAVKPKEDRMVIKVLMVATNYGGWQVAI